jgi:hypothetical protein
MRLPAAVLAAFALLAGCAAPHAPASTGTTMEPSTADAGDTATAAEPAEPRCPGHWHATFAVYVPSGAYGEKPMKRIDFASPRAAGGGAYYDLANRAGGMGLAVHMHQSGAETGSQALGPAQWHFEKDGTCVSVQEALASVEVEAMPYNLRLYGAHAQTHDAGTWVGNFTARVHLFTQEKGPDGAWTWKEGTYSGVIDRQLPDGASLLVAFGETFTDAEVQAMEESIPPPVSRPA